MANNNSKKTCILTFRYLDKKGFQFLITLCNNNNSCYSNVHWTLKLVEKNKIIMYLIFAYLNLYVNQFGCIPHP